MAIHTLAAGRALGLVIKGNAYGHGAYEVASVFDDDTRVSYFLTAGLAEGIALRAAGIKKPIMAMAYCDGDIEEALSCGVEPSIATDEELLHIARAANFLRKKISVHLKVDTGIARRGVSWDRVGELYRAAARESLLVETIFTHCADSSPSDVRFMYEQQRRFEVALGEARAYGFHGRAHMASSGSLTLIPGYDMVRVGTMLYGSWKNELQIERVRAQLPSVDLIPVMTLRAPLRRGNILALGYQDAFCTVAGAQLLLSCGCLSFLESVSAKKSVIKKHCFHDAQYGDLIGKNFEIRPADAARRQSTIANEITTRVYRHLPRIYSE
jgi:alanine racemase